MTQRLSRCQACQSPEEIFPFTMAFQPIVDVQECRIDAYEALVRGLDGEGAGQVLARVNAENVYKFDQACRVKAIEMAARLGMDRQLSINFLPNAVYEPRACIRATLEGVERRSEVDALRSVGARFMQGFYFAKPVFQGLCTDEAIFPSAG